MSHALDPEDDAALAVLDKLGRVHGPEETSVPEPEDEVEEVLRRLYHETIGILAYALEPAAVDRAIRAAESSRLVMATVAAPDAIAAVLQLVATLPPDEREVGRMRLAAVLRGVIAQRLVPKRAGEGREPVVEWLEITDGFRTAIMAGADPAALRKAMDKAVKEGRAETFASLAESN